MKRFVFIPVLFLITLSVSAQKATITIIKSKNKGLMTWQVIDGQNTLAFDGNEYFQNDTVIFSLEPNNYYFLKVSLGTVNNPDTSLLSLSLNNEPILLVKSDLEKGEHLFPFYTGVKTPDAKITGGTSAVISDFPWQVYYISGNFRCGGSIISGKWVVTAAHCTKNSSGGPILAADMSVRVGLNNPSNAAEGKTYQVSDYIVNSNFDQQTLLNDIALLHLKDSINFPNATPIKLVSSTDVANGAISPGVLAWITGWGLTHVSPNVLPTALQKVQLPIITNAQASTVWGNSIPVTDIMAGFLNGNKDACNGDSGGPLVVPVLGEFKLAGIVSWGSSSCDTYGAYTSISSMESWIRTNSGIAALFIPPSPVGDSIICQGTESSQYFIDPVAGATTYEWNLVPQIAGAITGNSQNASVIWNSSYTGTANVVVRTTINNVVSDWSNRKVNLVYNTALLSQSGDTTICAAQPVTLNVSVRGYNLNYKWFKDGIVVQTGTSSKLSFTPAITNDSGEYNCQITGSCGTVISKSLNLTVYPLTKITHLSPNTEVPFGNAVTLEVTADGHNLNYQWQKDGNILENSNTSQFLIPNLNANDIGIYKTTVTGTCGVQLSDSIYLYVKRTNFTADPEVFLWPSVTITEFTVALSNEDFYNIQLFSATGKKFKEILNCRYQTRVNVSTMAKGIYIVEVYNKNFRKSIKVIKE